MPGRLVSRLAALLAPLALLWTASSRGVFPSPAALACTLIVLATLTALELRRGLRLTAPALWLAGLVGWAALAAMLRPVDRGVAASYVATGAVAVILAALAMRPRAAAWGRTGVVAAGATAAGWLVVERAVAGGRPGGPFENPNLAATVVVLALSLLPLLPWALAARLAAGLLLLGGVLASGSRAGMLAVVAVGLAWAAAGGRRGLRTAVLALATVAAAGLVVRVASDRDPLRFERVRIWRAAVQTAAGELPFGSGPGGYADAAIAHNFPRHGELARYHRVPSLAESDLLELVGALGVPGLLLGAGLAVSVLRAARSCSQAWAPLAAVAVSSAVHTQLPLPAVAWTAALAVAGTLPRSPCRYLRLSAATAGLAALALGAAVALGLGAFPGVPMTATALVGRGATALARGETDDGALADAEAATWLGCMRRPRWAGGWRTLGHLRFTRAQRRDDRALAAAAADAFATARRANPLDVWAAVEEGRTRRLLGETTAAAEALGVAVRLEPHCAPAWFELALLHLDRGEVVAARNALGEVDAALAAARGRELTTGYERALVRIDPGALGRLRLRCGEVP